MKLQRYINLVAPAVFLILLHLSLISGTTRYVDQIVGTSGAGTSWATAYKQLYEATAVSSAGDSILVAAGVYKPTNINYRDSTFRIKGLQKVLGGYPNGGVGQRNWRNNPTVLSGDIGMPGDSTDNSYHVVSIINATQVILDGFVIEGGYANDTGYHAYGGGIYVSGGWAGDTVRNCTIRRNYAAKRGGGVYVKNIKGLIRDCKIYSNRTDSCGGGVYLEDDTTRVINCTFVNNKSALFGGGVYIKRTTLSVDSIVNCTFTRNSAVNGGGLYNMNTGVGRPAIINTILYYDMAVDSAFEISNNGGSSMPGIKKSDIMGCRNNVGAWAGPSFGSDSGGNLDTFPRFFDVDGIDNIIGTADDTLKLQMGSPCYMAGMTTGGIIPTTDIDSNSRSANPTIGAYEYTVIVPPGKKWENSAKDNKWGTSANWFPDEVPLGNDTVFMDGAVTAAACTLNVNDSIALINFVNSPGLFSFSSCTLKVAKDADFGGATGIVPGTGALIFGGSLNHNLKPKAGQIFPTILMNGVNTLQIINNPLRAKRLVLNGGTLHLGSYAAKDTVEDIKVNNGTFSFGNAQVYVSDSADFRYAGWITPDTGTLVFNGAGSQKFIPCSYTFPDVIVQNSAAVTAVDSNSLYMRSLTINAGGSFTAPTNNWLYVKGSFINNGTFNHNNGHIVFDSTNGSHTIAPGGSPFHYLKIGSGGSSAVYTFTNGFIADTLMEDYAFLNLGNYNHSVDDIIYGMMGKINFGACSLKVSGTADCSGFDSVITGTGVMQFTAPDTQTLKLPMNNDTLPAILHSGTGKLKLDYDSLIAVSFTQTAGKLDLNYRDVIVTGNFRILNGNDSSLINLKGRAITTGGSAEFQGQSGSLLNLNPDSAWTITAAGQLTADYAVIGRSTSGGTRGMASARCVDSMNNVNWRFDYVQPGNYITLSVHVVDTNKIILSWNPSAMDTTDADSVGIWYKTGGDFPDSAYDPTALLAGKYTLNDSIDTIYGLNKSTLYYFSLMARDSSGNWSDTATSANKSARTFNPGTKIWKGGAGNNNWATAANWLPYGTPLITDSVIFNSSSAGVCSLFVSDTIKCMTFESGYTGNLHVGGVYLLINNSLTINSGTLNLWSGVFVGVGSIATAGGCINFGTSNVQVSGDANLSGLDSLKNYASGNLEFAGVGTQVFTPKPSVIHPNVYHTASGTLRLATNDLSAASFSNTAGILDFNGRNITTVSSGNFTVSSGSSSTFAGLVGRTIVVNGNANFTGQSGNLLNMNAASSWFLDVTGTLTANYAVIGYSKADSGSTGTASATCLNAGNNSNWSFIIIDTVAPVPVSFGPPDNAVSVGLNDNLVVSFGEPVNKGTGNIIIARTSDNTVFETIAVGGANVTGGGTAVITINPAGTFASKISYYVRIDSTCFVDTAGNKYAGIYSNTAWNFTTIDVGTETPSLSLPASNGTIGDTFTITYMLPEKASTGSVKLSFIWAGGIPDPNAPQVVTFIPGYETAGSHATILSGNDLSNNANVASVSSNPNDKLIKYAVYNVMIEYQDSLGNAVAQATNTGITYAGGILGNNVSGDLSSKGDTAVIVSLNLSSAAYAKVAGVYFNLNPGAPSLDTVKALKLRYGDTTFTMYNIKDQGLWYGAWALYDSSANTGVIKYDSVPIGNTPPVLTLPAMDTAYVDSTWSISNCAYDLNGDTITLSLLSGPAGMSVVQSTLSIVWKPAASNIGTNLVIVSANDGKGGIAKDTMILFVYNINSAPVLSLPAQDTAYEDTAWSIAGFVSDADNDPVTLSLLSAPAGMTVSSINVSLNWTPANDDVGLHPVTVMASDPKGGKDTASMIVHVVNTNDFPKIDSTYLPSVAFEDSLYKGIIIVSDPDKNDSIAVTLNPALPWLKAEVKPVTGSSQWLIDIRGTPGNNDIGTFSVNCVVTDKSGAAISMIITLNVLNTNDYPHIDTAFFQDTVFEDSLVQGIIRVSDPDNKDTVSFSFSPAIPWLKVQKSQGNTDSLWIFTISGRPGNADTGLIQFAATIKDKGGLAATVTDKIYVINTNDPPQTLLVKKSKAYGALEYVMSGEDDFDTALSFCATVSDTSGHYDSSITNTTGLFQLYPLSDGTYFFACYAKDKEGLADLTPYRDTVRIAGVCTRTWTDSGTWNMVSVPAGTYSPEQFKKAGIILHWDESGVPDDIYKYYVRSDAIREITAGKSYWVRLDSAVTVKLNKDSLYKAVRTIRLRKAEYGWNQIASPYIYPVQCNKDIDLWRWNPVMRDFEMVTTDVLNPWEGYWVHTENADSVVLVPQPCFTGKALLKRSQTCFVEKTEWTFGIELTSNINRDADNLFGISAVAKDGCDRLDRAEPPRMGSEPYLYFAHPEWKKSIVEYASDIRRTWNTRENVFQIGISPCTKEVTALAMHITGYETDMPIYLFVNAGAGVIAYKPGMTIQLDPSAEPQYRTIFATGNMDFLDRFPQTFVMNNPYPNPCRPAATIRYTLPYRWESNGWLNTAPYKVKLVVYDARGRSVCELVNRKQEPGHYKLVWRGRSDTGRRLASGFYFVRLEAGKYSSVKKIIVMQ